MSSTLPAADEIPPRLLEYDQWLCWRAAERDGKVTKVPIDPHTGSFASTTDPATWASFETAREFADEEDEDGVGFVFTEDDPIVGVDLDDCRVPETGMVSGWADSIIEELDSFTEVSPSRTGLHVLVEGSLPEGRNRKGDVELYETARFFTVSGAHVDGTPRELHERSAELEAVYSEHLAPDEQDSGADRGGAAEGNDGSALDDDALLRKAKAAANGEKFQRLWRGSTSGYESHSEADMALCSLLAFWTGGDARQLDRLFRESGLLREKWDERHFADGSTYGEKTIERAIDGTSEFYEPTDDSGASAVRQGVTADTGTDSGREVDYVARISALERQLRRVLDEKEDLEDELAAERAKRLELEAELESERNSWFSVF